jgi:O-acetyl-ADP-ribose deacetylase (regulator of RNase III)
VIDLMAAVEPGRLLLRFIDTDPDVVRELARAFAGVTEVICSPGDILAVARNALVSPANSYGFMDGGIDAHYSQFFGPGLQAAVQEAINRRPEGYLPVGASLAVSTAHPRIPFLIVAPTMHTPEEVPAANCYRAMRAILRLVASEPWIAGEVFCPGLATGIGHVPPPEAAAEMFRAYRDWAARSRP